MEARDGTQEKRQPTNFSLLRGWYAKQLLFVFLRTELQKKLRSDVYYVLPKLGVVYLQGESIKTQHAKAKS